MPHMVQFKSISVQKRGPIFSNSQELAGGSFPRSTHRRSPGPAGDLGGTQTPRQEVRPPPNVKSWIRACDGLSQNKIISPFVF